MRIAVLAAVVAAALASPQTLDCPLRQIGLDYAQQLQPWRPIASFQEVADALNGAEEAQNCSVAPKVTAAAAAAPRIPAFPLPKSGFVVYADPNPVRGSDAAGDGSVSRPFLSIERALAAVRAKRAPVGAAALPSTIVLRAGTFHLQQTLQLAPEDSFLTIQAYTNEEVYISGGVPLEGVTWTPATPPARQLWEQRPGGLATGFDALPGGSYTLAQAQAACIAAPTCVSIAYDSSSGPNPTGPVAVVFKYETFWAASTANQTTLVLNRGYLPGGANVYTADLSSVLLPSADITGLRVGGSRVVRARYPNAKTVEQIDGMQIDAVHWTAQPMGTNANYTFNPQTPFRNDTIIDSHMSPPSPFFSTFRIGVGGPCAFRFTPQASYWCSSNSEGGGPGPYQAPVGMTTSNAGSSLPHTPYAADVSRALVHSWRAGRWFSWVFAVTGADFNAGSNQTVFNFSTAVGGNQGSRGGNAGQEFMIENVLDELDNPAEWYYDQAAQTLHLWHNATAGTPPPVDGTVVATELTVLINTTGTQASPVVGVGFLGVGFRDTAPNYLGPHGTPSGGDWAVGRSGALFFEGTVGTTIEGCLFTTLDGNAVFFSGYTRNATVTRSEFVSIGETAISQWGYTDGSPVPGMGLDATAGNQPRGTQVTYNLVHEVGLFTKQNSFYFQSESFGNAVNWNIAYNGPRAGVNFDDGMGGGSSVSYNVLFNFCRESSDHGPFNSWNRQVYVWDTPGGGTSIYKANDTISYNWILANYHSSMAIDNDDGSSFYDTHHNVFISAASGAAYGGNSLKSDFGGHSNFHHDNMDLFFDSGFGINGQVAGNEDGYYSNMLYQMKDGNYGSGQTCSGVGVTAVYNNTVWTPTGTVTECGMSLAAWQAKGGDPGTTASPFPADAVVLAAARTLLGVN